MISEKTRKFQVTETFTTRLLGTAPADKEVYKAFIAKKRQDEAERRSKAAERAGQPTIPPQGTEQEEVDTIREEAGITVFHSDVGQVCEDGSKGQGLFLFDYQVGGFWKEAGEILQAEHGIPMVRSKLDNFMLVEPRRIYIKDESGHALQKADMQIERPLRAMTMQGPRVSLACSEVVNPGRHIDYTVDFLPFLKSGRGKEAKALDIDKFVELILWFGKRKGRGQWRNGGNGKFDVAVKPVDLEKKEEPATA